MVPLKYRKRQATLVRHASTECRQFFRKAFGSSICPSSSGHVFHLVLCDVALANEYECSSDQSLSVIPQGYHSISALVFSENLITRPVVLTRWHRVHDVAQVQLKYPSHDQVALKTSVDTCSALIYIYLHRRYPAFKCSRRWTPFVEWRCSVGIIFLHTANL